MAGKPRVHRLRARAKGTDMTSTPTRVVIIGGGPAAHRLVDAIRSRDAGDGIHVTVIMEERHAPYDRVALSKRLGTDHDLTLESLWHDDHTVLHVNARATA